MTHEDEHTHVEIDQEQIEQELQEFGTIYKNVDAEIKKCDVNYEEMKIETYIEILEKVKITETHKYYQHLLDEFVFNHFEDFFDETDFADYHDYH